MVCVQGANARLLVDTDTTFDASSEIYDFVSESIAKNGRLVGAKGITGSRTNIQERSRFGAYTTGGQLVLEINPLDLDKWLPRILGAAEAADVFDVAETLPEFYMLIDKVGDIFRYDNCKVDRAIFVGNATPADEEPEVVKMILEIVARNEVTAGLSWPGTPPTLGTGENRRPYIMADGTFTARSGAREFHSFVLVIDNHIQPRWVNSLTPTELCARDRTIQLRVSTPFLAAYASALYAQDLAGATDGALAFTNGGVSTTFTFGTLQYADHTPVVNGKEEIAYIIDFIARKTGTDPDISVTNDSVA